MPDYITFENWPEHGRWLEFLKQEKQMKKYHAMIDLERYFSHLPVKERARRAGITAGHYYALKRKYGLNRDK